MSEITPFIQLDEMLTPFNIPKHDLAELLSENDSVIAGSFALASLIPDFGPIGDMDIFNPIPNSVLQSRSPVTIPSYYNQTKVWFEKYGYEEIKNKFCGSENIYDYTLYISKVQTFRHTITGAKIDFIHIYTIVNDVLSITDFTINTTYIKFRKNGGSSYTEEYVSRYYDDVINKRIVLMNIEKIIQVIDKSHPPRRSLPKSPIDYETSPKRLSRLEKYLSRGFTMDSEIEGKYRKVLASCI